MRMPKRWRHFRKLFHICKERVISDQVDLQLQLAGVLNVKITRAVSIDYSGNVDMSKSQTVAARQYSRS